MRRGAPALRPAGVALASAMAALLLGNACSREAGSPKAGEAEELRVRVQEYLELKQQHAWARIYDEVLDPESHNQLEKQRFLKKRERAFDILGFEILTAEQNGQEGRVRVQMEAMIPVLKPGGETSLIRKQVQDPQDWVFRDGRWYIRLEG